MIEQPAGQRQARPPVSVRRVESHCEAKQFVAMPWRVYGDDPLWRPTLRRVMHAKMNSKHNALHREVQIENFVAYRGGSPVGRISAAIDSAYVQRYGDCAFFGFFESVDDEAVTAALLGAAEQWAAGRGVTKMVGPFSYTSREEVGLLVSGYDRPPALMQPYNPRYYPALVEASGYRKKFDSASYRWHVDGSRDVRQRLLRRADAVMRDQGLTVRSVRMRRYADELEMLRGLYNDSFAHHPENVPLSREVFSGMAAEMRPLIDPNIVRIVESDGVPVGFLLMLPDVNEIVGRSGRLTPPLLARLAARREGRIRGIETAVVVLIGAVQTQFGAGIGRVLAGEIVRTITGSGYSSVATTWVHEDNVWSNSLTSQMKTDPEKIHRVYQKAL
ncbi:transcriptional regulator [Mycobacteroides saopaulense]|nr:transcriptional regulator [Mycobacteroides saopaulense]